MDDRFARNARGSACDRRRPAGCSPATPFGCCSLAAARWSRTSGCVLGLLRGSSGAAGSSGPSHLVLRSRPRSRGRRCTPSHPPRPLAPCGRRMRSGGWNSPTVWCFPLGTSGPPRAPAHARPDWRRRHAAALAMVRRSAPAQHWAIGFGPAADSRRNDAFQPGRSGARDPVARGQAEDRRPIHPRGRSSWLHSPYVQAPVTRRGHGWVMTLSESPAAPGRRDGFFPRGDTSTPVLAAALSHLLRRDEEYPASVAHVGFRRASSSWRGPSSGCRRPPSRCPPEMRAATSVSRRRCRGWRGTRVTSPLRSGASSLPSVDRCRHGSPSSVRGCRCDPATSTWRSGSGDRGETPPAAADLARRRRSSAVVTARSDRRAAMARWR